MIRFAGPLLLACALAQAQTPDWVDGSWKMRAGDRPEWALAGYDDSAWQDAPAPQRIGIQIPERSPHGPVWYRASFRIPPQWEGSRFAVLVGKLDDAWELYADGARIGGDGVLPPIDRSEGLAAYPENHQAIVLPAGLARDGEVKIALRRWLLPRANSWSHHNFVIGGASRWLHPPRLSLASFGGREEELHRMRLAAGRGAAIAVLLFVLACGCFSLALFLFDRSRREYLWAGVLLTASGFHPILSAVMTWTPWLPKNSVAAFVLTAILITLPSISYALAVSELAPPRYRWPLQISAGLHALSWMSLATAIWFGFGPKGGVLQWGSATMILTVSTVLVFTLWRSGRRSEAVLLGALSARYTPWERIALGSFAIPGEHWSSLAVAVVIVIVLWQRFRQNQRRRRQMEQEVEAARRIQALLLQPAVTGGELRVDAKTLTAREVGGDFHQMLPRDDGSQVLLVGDVSGKGMDAALVVAIIVGALRREQSSSPSAVLAGLNDVLTSQPTGGFVTCCCVRLEPGGRVTIANAGHIPPWLNGLEVAVEPGLPLGVTRDAQWPETTLEPPPYALLTLISDGVGEAANAKRELFGFERAQSMSTRPADEIAEAARAWGQNDDITVVTVRRAAA